MVRIRGVVIPTDEVMDLYADGDQWTTDPVPRLVRRRLTSAPGGPRGSLDFAGIRPTVAAAHEAGVRILAGTDSHPHGRVADEVLVSAGLSVTAALGAASWVARTYLGQGDWRRGRPRTQWCSTGIHGLTRPPSKPHYGSSCAAVWR
jgi:hypothetical protein